LYNIQTNITVTSDDTTLRGIQTTTTTRRTRILREQTKQVIKTAGRMSGRVIQEVSQTIQREIGGQEQIKQSKMKQDK